jgi:hypothetical protein
MIGYTLLLVLPGIFYKLSTHETTPGFSLDFLRGQGVDLIAMVIPTQRWLFAKIWNKLSSNGLDVVREKFSVESVRSALRDVLQELGVLITSSQSTV